MRDIFVTNNVKNILNRENKGVNKIYLIVLLLWIAILILLPIIKVQISVQGDGLIRPIKEKVQIKSLISGIVLQVCAKENQFVKKGEILLVLDTTVTKGRLYQTKNI